MTIEELKKEADKLGYSLLKKTKYEPLIPCKECGGKRRRMWSRFVDGHTIYSMQCIKCGFTVDGSARTEAEAKKLWNIGMRMVPAIKEDADGDNDQT